jgi:hypothetical protein
VGEEAPEGELGSEGTLIFSDIRILRRQRELVQSVFVDHWFRDYVLFGGPVAEVQQLAAFAAEWKVGILV